jgi:hypothetical protein
LFEANELIKRLGDDVGLALGQDCGVSHDANLKSQGQEEDAEHGKDRNQTSGQEPTTVPSHKLSHVGSPEGMLLGMQLSGANRVPNGVPRLPGNRN